MVLWLLLTSHLSQLAAHLSRLTSLDSTSVGRVDFHLPVTIHTDKKKAGKQKAPAKYMYKKVEEKHDAFIRCSIF
ncbi:MAG: hypothetical protein LBF22_09300 [Deltaproteobacteria bacterium]|nr:hypothetical protein [Deltaproteobacteria bacterium]